MNEEKYRVVMQDGGATWRVWSDEKEWFISSSRNKEDAELIVAALNSYKTTEGN